MTDRNRWSAAGFAGLVASLVASAPVTAQETTPVGRPATQPGEIGQRPDTPRPGQLDQRPAAAATATETTRAAEDMNTEHAMLVAHALHMAIEGSALHGSALAHAGSARPAAETANNANLNANANNNAEAASKANPYAVQLEQHARASFEASEKLFAQCEQTRTAGVAREGAQAQDDPARTGSPVGQFYSAANEYAETLRRISGVGGQAADRLSEQDKAAVCLINHGLCEVLGAWKIRTAADQHGSTGQAMAALAGHAQEMDSEGRRAIQQFATPLGNPREARLEAVEETERRVEAATERSPLVESLARNAQQMLQAVDQISRNNPALPAAAARPGVDPTAPEPGSGLRPGSTPDPGR